MYYDEAMGYCRAVLIGHGTHPLGSVQDIWNLTSAFSSVRKHLFLVHI